jgi:putative cell wall-binding protein
MRLRLALLLSLTCVAALAPAPGGAEHGAAHAQASAPAPRRAVPVAPGVQRLEYQFAKADGAPVAAQVLTVERRPDVRLTSVLGQGVVPGLENVRDMNRRLQPRGGVAVLNSGFWLNQPVGEPNSYFATGGRLISESETQGSKARGTFATTPAGLSIIDRIDARVRIEATPEPLTVTGLNRLDRTQPEVYADGPSPLYLYTPEYGRQVTLPQPGSGADRGTATILSIPGMTVAAAGPGSAAAAPAPRDVATGSTVPIPPDGVLLVGYNAARARLLRIPEGSALRAVTTVGFPERARSDLWREVREGVAAGPLIVRDGAMTAVASWEEEGFSNSAHSAPPAPRSAVGVRADGTTLLVAVDGRQYARDDPAEQHSAGMTMVELATFLIALGAVDALSLDGGGSTQLSVDGILRNRPCAALRRCGPPRLVGSGIAVVHDDLPVASERLSGAGREATAAAVALAGHPSGAPEVLLAAAGNFPDALAGGPLAATRDAPLLLTGRDQLAEVTRQALSTLGTRRITLLGGTSAISSGLEAELGRQGFTVNRLAGPGRVETAAAIAAAIDAPADRVFLAAAGGFADALSAAAPAGLLRAPVLLTGREQLPPATERAILAPHIREVVIVGGAGVIDPAVERTLRERRPDLQLTRLAGADRYGTARRINEWATTAIPDLDATGLVIARGDTFPDALAGGPLAAARRQLLMIVPGEDVRRAVDAGAYLDARGAGPLARVTLLGGLGVLSSYQQWQLDQLAR